MTPSAGNLWQQISDERSETADLVTDVDADLAIIGAGFTGLSAALSATEKGASVAVLEAQKIGFGASGRNVGLVNAGLWLPPDMVRQKMGSDAGERLITALGQGPDLVFDLIAKHGISCEAVRRGTLHCAHRPHAVRSLAERARQWQTLDAPVTLVTAREAQDRVGSDHVYGALHDARAGVINPLAYTQGLARAATSAGAQVFENAPVTEITRENNRWTLCVGNRRVSANAVLVATNAYHQPIGHVADPSASVVHYFQAATAPIDNDALMPGGEGCWDTALVMSSFRRDAAGRVLLGGMGLPDMGGAAHLSWARRKLARLFPALRDIPFETFWSGRISMTRDHIPKLVSGGPGFYSMFGYSGRGIAPGTVMGTALGRALLDGNMRDVPLPAVTTYKEPLTRLRTLGYEAAARGWHILDR